MKTLTNIFLFIVTFFALSSQAQRTGEPLFITSAIGGKTLHVKNGGTENRTPLILWDNLSTKEQRFTLEDAGDGYYYIKSDLGHYIHVADRSSQPRALAHMWNGKGYDNTKWSFKRTAGGYYYIRSKKGTYLDVQWGKSANGTPIWMWTYNGGKAQQWKLEGAPRTTMVSSRPATSETYNKKTITKTITPQSIKGLCPNSLVGGDLDFGGNGPHVFGGIMLVLSDNKQEVFAQISFNAQETKSDWMTGKSEVKGFWKVPVYKAPYGMKIKALTSNDLQTKFDKVLRGGGASELLGGGGDGSPHFLTIGDGLENKGKVAQIELVGDTGGWDISRDTDCTNDTRILEIKFKPIQVVLTHK